MLQAEPGLSIVVSSYNYRPYLRAAIDSALAQAIDHLQVIVVDDGSTDGSIALIEGYGARIETVLQSNRGQVESCAAGLARCRHDIVIFLDSDDRLEPFAAAEITALWTPATVKVQYALQAIDSRGALVNTVFPKYPHRLTPETVRAELLRAGVYPATTTSGTAFSRRFLEQVMPIPASYDCDIDDALNVVAPLHGDVQTLRKTLGQYRVHDRNSSAHAELTAARFERYLTDAEERTRYLRDRCRERGIEIADDLLDHDLAFWENRLAAAVLKPDARLPLLPATFRAAFASILDPGQRLMHAFWAAALALTPRPLARRLLAQRFIFNRRSRLVEALLETVWKLGRSSRSAADRPQEQARPIGEAGEAGGSPLLPLAAFEGNDDARI